MYYVFFSRMLGESLLMKRNLIPVIAIDAILPGSKWSVLLLRVVIEKMRCVCVGFPSLP